jgi:hypothetical protein
LVLGAGSRSQRDRENDKMLCLTTEPVPKPHRQEHPEGRKGCSWGEA